MTQPGPQLPEKQSSPLPHAVPSASASPWSTQAGPALQSVSPSWHGLAGVQLAPATQPLVPVLPVQAREGAGGAALAERRPAVVEAPAVAVGVPTPRAVGEVASPGGPRPRHASSARESRPASRAAPREMANPPSGARRAQPDAGTGS